MRILLGSESYYPNVDGGAVAERALAKGQSALGHKVAIIAPSFKGMVNYSEQDGPTTIFRPKAVNFPLYKEYNATVFPYKYIESVANRFKPDVIHIHNPYPIGYGLIKWAKRNNIPVVGSNHLMPENFFMTVRKFYFLYKPLKTLGWKFITRFYNRCDAVVSPSKTAIRLLKEGGLRRPGYALSNGVDLTVSVRELMETISRRFMELIRSIRLSSTVEGWAARNHSMCLSGLFPSLQKK